MGTKALGRAGSADALGIGVMVGIAVWLSAAVLAGPAGDGQARVTGIVLGKVAPMAVILWVGLRVFYVAAVSRQIGLSEEREIAWADAEVPPGLHPTLQLVATLGFRFLGVVEERTPWRDATKSWLFVDATRTVVASIWPRGGSFFSCWEGGRHVTTVVASGRVDVRCRDAVHLWWCGPLGNVLTRHRAEVETFGAVNGDPLMFDGLADYLATNRGGREVEQKLFRALWLRRANVVPLVATILIALLVIALS